ncbi:transmembrane protein, putative [Medicago truncatula]|uniref:Transmembrane protein, putative n=1 Tax=Medicago truncatula TaxID=3880 RepID=G7K133_MEDTR|nr:transmembrane protein, putative [Medicago truncatula]
MLMLPFLSTLVASVVFVLAVMEGFFFYCASVVYVGMKLVPFRRIISKQWNGIFVPLRSISFRSFRSAPLVLGYPNRALDILIHEGNKMGIEFNTELMMTTLPPRTGIKVSPT